MPAATNEEFFNGRLGACLKIRVRVAQATGLGRPATRRTEREGRHRPMRAGFFCGASHPFGRRVADRNRRVACSTHFSDRLSGWRRLRFIWRERLRPMKREGGVAFDG